MNKQELLKKLHEVALVGYDGPLGGDPLDELHALIKSEIEAEESAGTMRTRRLPNGHMAEIEVVK